MISAETIRRFTTAHETSIYIYVNITALDSLIVCNNVLNMKLLLLLLVNDFQLPPIFFV